MKEKIHPKTRLVIFEDAQTGAQFLIESTLNTKSSGIYKEDGKEYPLIKLEVTSETHPFYTGTQGFTVAAGRVDKFNKRYGINKDNQKK